MREKERKGREFTQHRKRVRLDGKEREIQKSGPGGEFTEKSGRRETE